ncbi:uncharacterized protein PAM68-like [Magnolia sinica]|uniref:uncharacterized protein PAM68-like n=1 Tax=Magnolia sinica TaxID=86752 RepID=UPI00265A5E10|nr:uncharacterized protein PAM68-like [Magnolia sinica]
MNTLVCLRSKPLYTKSTIPCMKRSPTQHPTAIHSPYNPLHTPYSARARPPQAGAKGFGVPVPDKYRRREDKEEEEEASNKNEGGDEDEDAIPQVVFERMLVRIVFYVGAPMATGVGLLYLLGVLKEQRVWDAPVWLPFLTALLAFGTSALGIAYGTLSTSWDPDKKGTLLGWEEAQKNWPELWKEESEKR